MSDAPHVSSPFVQALRLLIRGYQRLPRLGPPRCRFVPSCSSYTSTALATHGAMRGLLLGGRRLVRCHPFHPGGVDHVPPPSSPKGVKEHRL